MDKQTLEVLKDLADKARINYATTQRETFAQEYEALTSAISLCSDYIASEGKVKGDIQPETRIAEPLCEISFNKGRIIGYRSGRHDTLMAMMKMITVDELYKLISEEGISGVIGMQIAKRIHRALLGDKTPPEKCPL